jgi:hypothetical protein
MIRWILLLQEFDLHILQRKEETLETQDPSDEEKPKENWLQFVASGYSQPRKRGFYAILCDGLVKHFLPTIYEGKMKII